MIGTFGFMAELCYSSSNMLWTEAGVESSRFVIVLLQI